MQNNYKNISKLGESGKFSSLRIYIAVEHYFSGNIHSHQISALASILGCSKSLIYRQLGQLEKLGYVRRNNLAANNKHSNRTWWHIVSHQQRCGHGSTIPINEELFLKEGVKYLRTLYYSLKIRSAYRLSKKNYRKLKKRDQLAYIDPKASKRKCPRTGWYKTSGDFIKRVTLIDRANQTINKHLHRSEKYGLLEIQSMNQYFGAYNTANEVINILSNLKEDNLFFIKHNNIYRIYKKQCNIIRMNY